MTLLLLFAATQTSCIGRLMHRPEVIRHGGAKNGESWAVTMRFPRENGLRPHIAPVEDGFFVVGGSAVEEKGSEGNSSLNFAKLDMRGRLVFVRKFKNPGWNVSQMTAAGTEDGGFVFAGSITREEHTYEGVVGRLIAARFGPDGELKWKSLPALPGFYVIGHAISPAGDGGFAISASSSISKSERHPKSTIMLDAGGKELWRRTDNSGKMWFFDGVEMESDGTLIEAGRIYIKGAKNTRLYVRRTKRDGKDGGVKIMDTDIPEGENMGVMRCLPDGGGVVALAEDDRGGGKQTRSAALLRIGGDGVVLWKTPLFEGTEIGESGLAKDAGGGFVAAMAVSFMPSQNVDGCTPGKECEALFVTKIGPDGKVAWKRYFARLKNIFGADIKPAAGGGFIIASRARVEGRSREFIHGSVLLKLDSGGNCVDCF